MCGIGGIVHDDPERSVDPATLRAMARRMVHRGPDGEGFHLSPPCGLLHRRLSIIDLEGGHQPMSNEGGTVWVVFNGEIYNFQELRRRLEERGHRFRTRSDTEILVHLYEEHGPELVGHLRGMFAFAIWDEDRGGTLLLARDRLGKKPLYYAERDGSFAFASELKALLAWRPLVPEVDPEAVSHYLTYGYVPAPQSMLRDVWKLPPAHLLVRRGGRHTIQRYWRLDYRRKIHLPRREDYLQLIRSEVEEATRLRLVADVPVGAFLSGGIDSGSVVASMAAATREPVRTFTIGFRERRYSELDLARSVAQRYGTDHRERIVEPDTLAVLPDLVWYFDEPFADFSAVPTHQVARVTRESVTVALTGDGGDESFAGYPRYRFGLLTWKWPPLPRPLASALSVATDAFARRLRSPGLRRARNLLDALRHYPDPRRRHARWVSIYYTAAEKARVLHPDLAATLAPVDSIGRVARLFDEVLADDPLDRILAVDVETYLAQDLLVKMDLATMAASLEARSPYLDHRVMEAAARIPASLKLGRIGATKPLLRDAWRDRLPPAVIGGAKRGFRMPVDQWLRGDLGRRVEAFLLEDPSPFWRPAGVRELFREHADGRDDHTFRLWAILWFELWYRRVIRRESLAGWP